jgi:hypothetical protein
MTVNREHRSDITCDANIATKSWVISDSALSSDHDSAFGRGSVHNITTRPMDVPNRTRPGHRPLPTHGGDIGRRNLTAGHIADSAAGGRSQCPTPSFATTVPKPASLALVCVVRLKMVRSKARC